MTVLFRVLWAVDVVVALVAVAFFFIGVGDGSVSSFNIVLWAAILAGLAAVVFGANALAARGHAVPGILLAAVPALPAILFGVWMLAAVLTGARWN